MRWLVGGQVYDVEQGSFRAADIGVEDGRISTIRSGARREAGDEVVDAHGVHRNPAARKG